MKALTPRAPGVLGSVRAKRRNVPAKRAVEMNCFVPEMPPAVAVRLRSRPQRSSVGAGLGLRERERPDHLAAGQRRNEARPLLVGAEVEDRQRYGARMHADRHPHAGVRPGDLLEDEDVRDEVRARAAVLLRDAHAHQAELGELAEDLLREVVLAIPLRRVRLDLGRSEVARDRLDVPLLRSELEVHYE